MTTMTLYKPRRKMIRYKKSKRRKAKIPRTPSIGYLRCYQKYSFQNTLQTLVGETGLSLSFALKNIANAPTFAALFDSYRIRGVTVKGFPLTNVGSGVNPVYKMLSCRDYDDDTQPTVATMINRAGVKTQIISPEGNTRQTYIWKLKPRFQTMMYESATQTGYGLGNRSMWINTQDAKVPHFGLKICFDTDPGLNSEVIWQWYVTLDVDFKSVKSLD